MDMDSDSPIIASSDPTEALIAVWHVMYPTAYGPWEDTDEPCPNGPECACGGKGMRQERTVLRSYVN